MSELDPQLAQAYQLNVDKFLAFLHRIPFATFPAVSQPEIGVIITPWLLSPAPFFSLVMALLSRQRGYGLLLIWDDLTPQKNPEATILENQAIARLQVAIPPDLFGIRWIKLSDLPDAPLTAEDDQELVRLAQLNAFWQLQITVLCEQVQEYQTYYYNGLRQNLPKIKSLVQTLTVSTILVPGGIYGNSGLFYWAGHQYPLRLASYDIGFSEELWFGVDSPACHLFDIPKIVEAREALFTPDQLAQAIEIAQYELLLRVEGRDRFKSQVVGGSAAPPIDVWDVVIPLNIDYDSAALGQAGLFTSAYEWLTESVRFILEQTSASVAVRQHPTERVWGESSLMAEELIKTFGGHPRFRFVSAWEQVNTYNLMRQCKLVLPFTSTIGIEAAIFGKPVVMERQAYYANLPFVVRAVSREDYFSKIRFFLESPHALTPEVLDTAWICYFFSQVCYMVATPWTPNATDFTRWVDQSWESLLANAQMQLVLTAFLEGTPVPQLQSYSVLSTRSQQLQTEGIDRAQVLQALQRLMASPPPAAIAPADAASQIPAGLSEGMMQLNQGRTVEALQRFSQVDEPGNPSTGYVRAIALLRLNRLSEAIALLQSILARDPGHRPSQRLLSELQTLTGPLAPLRPEVWASEVNPQLLGSYFPGVSFGDGVQCLGIDNTAIAPGSCIADQVWLNICVRDDRLRLKIGKCVLIGRQSMVSTGGYLEIGDYTLTAPRIYLSNADHVVNDITRPYMDQGAVLEQSLIIEENCWIGINAVITGNLTVGRGSVVGANSVVKQDVPPFAIVAGSPAHIIKLYNPLTRQWERVRTETERQTLMAVRQSVGLPSREEYQQLLAQSARSQQIDPLLAGRGVSI